MAVVAAVLRTGAALPLGRYAPATLPIFQEGAAPAEPSFSCAIGLASHLLFTKDDRITVVISVGRLGDVGTVAGHKHLSGGGWIWVATCRNSARR